MPSFKDILIWPFKTRKGDENMTGRMLALKSLQNKGLVADWRLVQHVNRKEWLTKAKQLGVHSINSDLDTISVQAVEWTKGTSLLVAIEYEKLRPMFEFYGKKSYYEYGILAATGVRLGLTTPASTAIATLRIQETFASSKPKVALSVMHQPSNIWRYHMFCLLDNPGKSDERVIDFLEVRGGALFRKDNDLLMGSVIIFMI
jgi:hypothetical protein